LTIQPPTISGPSAAFGFDEGTGSTVSDASGSGITGQIRKATWTSTAKYGKALSFNGSSAYVDLGNPSPLQSTGSMTWSAWVYSTGNPPDDGQIIARSDDTVGWQFKTSPDTHVRTFAVGVSGSSTSGVTQRYSRTVIASKTWYYVAGVYDASARTLDIYVNGVLDNGVLRGTVPGSQFLPNLNTTIGKRSGGYYFKGTIDELRVYNRALSAAEIQRDMNTAVSSLLSAHALVSSAKPVHSGPASAASEQRGGLPTQVRDAVYGLSCAQGTAAAGTQVSCELRTSASSQPRAIGLTSSSDQVKVPAVVRSRPNQTRLTFVASVDPAAAQQPVTLTAVFGDSQVQNTILLTSAGHPVLSVPGTQAARFGSPLRLTVSAVDPASLPVQLTANALPAGATFDAASGRFEWTPVVGQEGTYQVEFVATNSARQSSSRRVTIDVDSGRPVLNRSRQFACSPGAVAALTGKWLAAPDSDLSDPSGSSMELGGTKVKVNGQYVPVLFSSAGQVNFLCPALDAGTPLSVVVETADAAAEPLAGAMRIASPKIFSLDGSGENQGLISFADSTEVAMDRNFQLPAHPAQPGDVILLWATGFGSFANLSVRIGDADVPVESVQPASGYAGVYIVRVRVPNVTNFGSAVPVQLEIAAAGGERFTSGAVTIALEPVMQ
jgi:uncharacterized protein (TIGR03437 family)